ncbi:hypothetical protein TFLX_04071 [Thermoflexales bacterium]|nr:hypothetical protein TFLX_04071 [Thermoflexales bacterium]
MTISNLIKHPYTEDLNKEELIYREKIQPQEYSFDDVAKSVERLADGRMNLLPLLFKTVDFRGEMLELGAGSCWFGSVLSRLQSVDKIYCLDMSERILCDVAPHIMAHLEADGDKLIRVVGDFHKLYFEDGQFDHVVFDASLHHIPELNWNKVLGEVYRVLKPAGRVVAIREPFLSPIPTIRSWQRRTQGAHERRLGVTENLYTRREWDSKFRSVGFRSHFVAYVPLQPSKSVTAKEILKQAVKNSALRKLYSLLKPAYIIILDKA